MVGMYVDARRSRCMRAWHGREAVAAAVANTRIQNAVDQTDTKTQSRRSRGPLDTLHGMRFGIVLCADMESERTIDSKE